MVPTKPSFIPSLPFIQCTARQTPRAIFSLRAPYELSPPPCPRSEQRYAQSKGYDGVCMCPLPACACLPHTRCTIIKVRPQWSRTRLVLYFTPPTTWVVIIIITLALPVVCTHARLVIRPLVFSGLEPNHLSRQSSLVDFSMNQGWGFFLIVFFSCAQKAFSSKLNRISVSLRRNADLHCAHVPFPPFVQHVWKTNLLKYKTPAWTK